MIINLIFDQSGGPGFASFVSGVESAALILDRAITDPITVTIEIGYGEFPTDHSSIPSGVAEAEPNSLLTLTSSFTRVVNALSAGAALGDTNFNVLTSIVAIIGSGGHGLCRLPGHRKRRHGEQDNSAERRHA
jgi:hypothetical protein